jgi:hypothetical protein
VPIYREKGREERYESCSVLRETPKSAPAWKNEGEQVNKKEMKDFIKKARQLTKPFRVTDDSFRLHRGTGEALEVFGQRYQGATVLG